MHVSVFDTDIHVSNFMSYLICRRKDSLKRPDKDVVVERVLQMVGRKLRMSTIQYLSIIVFFH